MRPASALFISVLCAVSGTAAHAQRPSFDCSKARFPDEFVICRTPQLAELDNLAAAGYAFLKSTRGRPFADQIGIPFWRLRQACQSDAYCIRQRQIEAINAYQAAGAPVSTPTWASAAEQTSDRAVNIQNEALSELHLCRNSKEAIDKIVHCANVIASSSKTSALVTAHNTRGLAYMDVGRFREAIDDFSFVIQHEPSVAGYYDNRQNAYRRSGLLDAALNDANRAIQLAPSYSFVYRSRANVYNDMGKYDLAVLDYNEAIRIAPEDGGLFIDRGKIFRSQSKFDEALADFSHALDLDKKWTAAYRERGLTYKLLNRPEPALSDLTTYDQLEPGDAEVLAALAELKRSGPENSNEAPAIPGKTISDFPSSLTPAAQPLGSGGTTVVPMVQSGGTFAVPVTINNQLTLKFVVDSGASDVSIPADVVLTLVRTETITDADFLGKQTYTMADGSTVPSQRFMIRSLKVGDKTLENVVGSIAPVAGSLLLGQSFLSRFNSWSIDNQRQALILK
jgi:tetratricopeptide (TPR) repeat protein